MVRGLLLFDFYFFDGAPGKIKLLTVINFVGSDLTKLSVLYFLAQVEGERVSIMG